MANTHFATSGLVGVDLNNVTSSANRANGIGQMFALNQTVRGSNDSEWLMVYASAAITQYALCTVEASGTASMATSTTARPQPIRYGIAQQAFSAGDYGWIATEGTALTVLTTAVSTAGERLYTTATAGRVSTAVASATDIGIGGLFLKTTTTGAGASSTGAIAKNLVGINPSTLFA